MPQGISHFTPELVLDYEIKDLFAEIVLSEQGRGPFSDAIMLRMHEATSLLAKLIVDETPVNFGHLSGAISQSPTVFYGDKTFYGEVSDGGIEYAIPVEYGVQPFTGKGPSRKMVENLQLWIVRKQLQWYKTLKSGKTVKLTPEQMAWALAWHIAKTGTEGAFMFKKGLDQAKPHIDRLWEDLIGDLQVIWNKGK